MLAAFRQAENAKGAPRPAPPCVRVRAGKRELVELGPGQQIKAMVRRVDGEAWKAFRNVAA